MKKLAAVVVSDKGEILPYTAEATKEQCEAKAERFFEKEIWKKLKHLGARVATCEIVLLE